MTGRLLVFAGSALLLLAAASPGADRPKAPAEEVQDIVFLSDAGPVHIRLRVRVDGRPFRTAFGRAWEEYVRRLFRHLDRNGDGVLSEAEAAGLPPPLRLTGQTNVAFNFRAIDADGDGRVTLQELLEYYQEFGGGALQAELMTSAARVPPAVDDKLFTLLDTDRDGKLSRKELQAAPGLLRLDRDEDELLSPAELAPELFGAAPAALAGPPPVMSRPASAVRSPFLLLEPGGERATLAARILEQYGRGDKTVGRAALGLQRAAFDRLDANRDGVLDSRELEKFADGPPDLELLFRLGKRERGEQALEVITPRGGVFRTKGGTLLFRAGKSLLEFRCNAGRPRPAAGTRDRILRRFRSAAGPRGYLTLADARRAEFFPGLFPLLDRDGDGKLTEKELVDYLDTVGEPQARAVGNVTALWISDEGRGLFGLLDRNRDGRLSRRELASAAELPAALGLPAEGGLARSDMPRSYQLAVGLTRASFNPLPGDGEVFSPAGMPLLALEWAPPGLLWFPKMDRNHDGDVSRREFLGTRAQFERLDADGDGLISLEEAERAVELFAPKKTPQADGVGR